MTNLRTRQIGIVAVLLLCVAGGFVFASPKEQPAPDLDFNVIRGDDVAFAPEIGHWLGLVRTKPGLHIVEHGHLRVVLVALGEQPTAGYSVKLGEVNLVDGVWIVDMTITVPGAGEMVAEVLTYPQAAIAFENDGRPVRVRDAQTGQFFGPAR